MINVDLQQLVQALDAETRRELEAAAERNAMDRGNHRHRELAPAPHRLLRKIGLAVGADREIALLAARHSVTAILHGGEPAHVEAGTKRPALAGQHHDPNPFFLGKPVGCGDQCLEHRGIERVHLVRPHQADIGDTV